MRTLLLADDNVTVQRVIALTFAQEPVRVVTASDGHQAMDRVVMERPDIILAGTTLPQVNGYELARFVRSKAELKNVPVLLLSGAFETVDEAQLKSSGAAGVIEKPVEPIAVISRVKELLGLTVAGHDAGPERGRLVTPAAAVPESRAATAPPPAAAVPSPPPADPLESAYDALDRQMAGHHQPATPAHRNPAPPLGQIAAPRDPRSPGRPPSTGIDSDPANPVYEIDDSWFADHGSQESQREDSSPGPADAARALQARVAAPDAAPVYEVDDEWFAEDRKARQAREIEHKQLAAEMGIHEVELPPAPAEHERPRPLKRREATEPAGTVEPDTPARPVAAVEPAKTVEPTRIIEPLTAVEPPRNTAVEPPRIVEPVTAVEPVTTEPVAPVEPPTVVHAESARPKDVERAEPVAHIELAKPPETEFEPIPRALPIDWFPKSQRKAATPSETAPAPIAPRPEPPVVETPRAAPAPIAEFDSGRPMTSETPGRVADDFAALLAFEQGHNPRPPITEPIIHAVAPEITPEMLEQIASTVADRLRGSIQVEPQAPEITAEMLARLAGMVAGGLQQTLRVEPAAPVITTGIIEQISGLVASQLSGTIRVEPAAPELNDDMLARVAGMVADRLYGSIRVEPRAPEMTTDLLKQLADHVAERLRESIHVEAKTPEVHEGMLQVVAAGVAERLRHSIRVEPKAADITDEMLARIGETVAARLKDSIRVEPAIPELSAAMIEQIAGTVSERLTDAVEGTVTWSMQRIAAALQTGLAEAVKANAAPPQLTNEMLDHVAWTVADRVSNAMPAPAPPAAPQITDEVIDRVAGRVAERVHGDLSLDRLTGPIADAVRDTVRAVVAETSERLVREEIERIKSKAQ